MSKGRVWQVPVKHDVTRRREIAKPEGGYVPTTTHHGRTGLGAKLPLRPDGGYELLSDLYEMVMQNFKMLMLTAPGERMWSTDFGVGLRNFLFEMDHHTTYSLIESRIRSQTTRYLPYIDISNIDFKSSQDNLLSVSISFVIVPMGESVRFTVFPVSDSPTKKLSTSVTLPGAPQVSSLRPPGPVS